VGAGRWHLGLDPSAVQDGSYPDFHRGQQAEFAVTFQFEAWEHAAETTVATARVEGSRYDLVAPVVATGDEWWVLDCGLVVGCGDRPPAGVEVGHWVKGRADLGLSRRPHLLPVDGAPPLVHAWFVERIHRRTGADAGIDDLGPTGMEGLYGGAEEPGWEEVGFSDAWHDDNGRAEYVLECLLVRAGASP